MFNAAIERREFRGYSSQGHLSALKAPFARAIAAEHHSAQRACGL